MKEKISYLIAAFIIYFIVGLFVSYFGYSMIDWKFVMFWSLSMSIFDFFVIRYIRKWLSKKNKSV